MTHHRITRTSALDVITRKSALVVRSTPYSITLRIDRDDVTFDRRSRLPMRPHSRSTWRLAATP